MTREIDEEFDEVIPAASNRGRQFLGVLQKRCQAENLGIELVATKPDRKKDRIVLVADIRTKGRRRRMEVFADPIGSGLHVGWQTTFEVVSGTLAYTQFGQDLEDRLSGIDARSDNVMALSGVMQAFHTLVFLPVLQQLIDAVTRA